MSKSKRNVIDPQEMVDRYGADTVRMFCLFASPPERDLEWSEQGVEGSHRFLNRVWRLVTENLERLRASAVYDGEGEPAEPFRSLHRKTHRTIQKVTADIEDRFHFNTAISAVMELMNDVSRILGEGPDPGEEGWPVIREALEAAVVLLSPVVPHITEELWSLLGREENLLSVSWPRYRAEALEVETRTVVLQVNGKLRSRIEVAADAGREELEKAALADERVRKFVGDRVVKKVIVVPGKLVNVVV
jgi:leucyl-tRNA synthetase